MTVDDIRVKQDEHAQREIVEWLESELSRFRGRQYVLTSPSCL